MKAKIKIWIIEDEAIIAQNLQWTLEDLGYEVPGQSYDYESALDALNNEQFDLLMLDINLNSPNPAHDGLAIAARLRETKDVPFIFLTAYDDRDTIKKAAQLRPSAYLIKPVNAATLFAAVQTAIENHREAKSAALPHEQTEVPDYFFSKIGHKIHKVHWKEVAKMESVKNYVSIKTANSTTEFLIRGSLVQVMQNMVPAALHPDFFKINRATIVHRSAIIALHFDSVDTTFGRLESTEDTIRELRRALL
jgi:two-component system, LytTR family, response regulator LytT